MHFMPTKQKQKRFVNFSMPIKEGLEEVKRQIGKDFIEVTGEDGNTYRVKGKSLRLRTFKATGTACPLCDAKATHWVLTFTAPGQAHLNLMGENGLLFTHDHIEPLSQGGADHISNTHVMCGPCNWFLGSKTEDQLKVSQETDPLSILPNTTTVYYDQPRNLWRVRVKHSQSTKRKPKYLSSVHATREAALSFAHLLTPNPVVRECLQELPVPRTDLEPSPLYRMIVGEN
jgi:hypothetical protein